jgi:AcrR family transcriptional regulator
VQDAVAHAEIVTFPLLAEQLPGPPPASLDPVLDASVECITRHGLSKTSLSDIARELGVAPSTVYRKVGSVENAAQLVMAREGARLLRRVPEVIAGVEGPRVITVFLAECIETTRRHPMVDKILRDEIDWVGRLATRGLGEAFTRSSDAAVPWLVRAMDAGFVRVQDPAVLAQWIARITFTCLLAPPPGDLLEALDALLVPVLDPEPAPSGPRSRSTRGEARTATTSRQAARAATKEQHRA